MGTKLSERTVQPYGKRRIRPSAGRFTVQAFAHSCAHACATAITIVASVLATRAAEHDFYKDKQVRLIISSASGGVYDTFGRLMARFLPAHLPGRPTIIVQNMPGASGLRAVNYLYNGAPRDGTVIAGVHNGIPTAPFEEPKQAHFDVNELSWIGSISEDPFVGYVWHGAPVQTYEDA